MEQHNGNEITPPSYEHVSTHVSTSFTENQLRETVLWLFWRKVLKLRGYKLKERIVECFKIDGKLKARVIIRFKQPLYKRVFTVSLSKHEPSFFTVAYPGGEVFKSELCINMREFEQEFMRFFFRRIPILPTTAGVFT